MRKWLFIIIVVLSAIYYFHDSNLAPESVRQSVSKLKNMVKNSTFTPSKGAATEKNTSPAPAEVQNLQALTPEELSAWIGRESRAMDSTNNPEDAQIKIKAQARTLTAAQLPWLMQKALDTSAPANGRIFSAYLLTLSELPESVAAIYELAGKKLPDLGPVLPHSEAEIRHGEELALRYMQVDELFQRAKTDADALKKLRSLATTAEEERVRSYAEKTLKELK